MASSGRVGDVRTCLKNCKKLLIRGTRKVFVGKIPSLQGTSGATKLQGNVR